MTLNGILQISLFLITLVLLARPLGSYIARVLQGERTWLGRLFGPLERIIYYLARINPIQEMDWKTYTISMLVFNATGILVLYMILRLQGSLPLNPVGLSAVSPDLAFNTAASFTSNTNWQNYAGETTLSNLTQMMGLTVQNFLSAATGIAILAAFIRGLARHSSKTLGNFWVDLTRVTLYILLPLAFALSLFLVSQGVVQTLNPTQSVRLLQTTIDQYNQPINNQALALGSVASQVAIKHIGTNGGGFFNTNTAHPYENPTPLTDYVLIISEAAIAIALTYTFGKMIGDKRQGWALLAGMIIVLGIFMFGLYAAETAGNPRLEALGIDQTASSINPGGNMEGKELRFGIPGSVIFAATTTATSTGAVNAMHDSFSPLGGLALLLLMQLGEVILGGVGSGLYGMLVFVIVAVFVAGLMVGRTPEYLGKKIEPFEIKMASLAILIMPVFVLGFTALSVVIQPGTAAILNPGPHGFSEVLYAFTSQVNNNGSAFAGLRENTLFYNLIGSLAMLIGRYWSVIPVLAIAGSLVKKKKSPVTPGTLPTYTPLFIGWLVAIVILIGALNFLPALALGPIVEHIILFQ